jgi:hypothetical protein
MFNSLIFKSTTVKNCSQTAVRLPVQLYLGLLVAFVFSITQVTELEARWSLNFKMVLFQFNLLCCQLCYQLAVFYFWH